MYIAFSVKQKIVMCCRTAAEVPSNSVHPKPVGGSRFIPSGRTLERMNTTKLRVALRSCFAKRPTKKNNFYRAVVLFEANSGSASQGSPQAFIESQCSFPYTQKQTFGLINPLYTVTYVSLIFCYYQPVYALVAHLL